MLLSRFSLLVFRFPGRCGSWVEKNHNRFNSEIRFTFCITIWLFNIANWKDPPFSIGKPSISMGHRKTMANC